MKTALIAFIVALTVPVTASAWEKQFRDMYIPEGCKTEVCQNPYNEKFNAAFAKGDMKTALKYCFEITRGDVPALPMPDAYIACAEAGSIRKMGLLSRYYQEVDPQPEKMFFWAKKGAVLKDGTPYAWKGGVPHPDSKMAWRQLCKAYYYGNGTKKDDEAAYPICYTVGYEQAQSSVVADRESAEITRILSAGFSKARGYAGAVAEGIELQEKQNILRETRESYRKAYGNPY